MRIDLDYKRLAPAFLITLLSTLFLPVLIPSAHLIPFAPFLIITYYQLPLITCLWISLACGTIVDLLASYHHFGLYALNFCVCTALLYQRKKNFFADRISTLPLMIFFFSLLSTLCQTILYHIYEHSLILSWHWFITDMILLPFFDALFGFTIFIVPALLLGYRPKKGEDYFTKTQKSSR